MTFLIWDWLRKNVILVMTVMAMLCLVTALGEVVRGATWSLFVPVALAAVACSWGLSRSRLNPKQAWVSLTALGIPGVFLFVGGLVRPLGRLLLSLFALIPQFILWMFERLPVDTGPLVATWAELTEHLASLFTRLGSWGVAFFSGRSFVDPLAAGMVWNVLLWFVGIWAGWGVRRNRQALQALAPGAALLALVLDYTRSDPWLVVVYLAILLTLMGLVKNEWRHLGWQERKVDYSESIVLDTLAMVGLVTIALVLTAAGTPSLSWRDLVEKLQEKDRTAEDRAAESLGLRPQVNVAEEEAYRSDGLPRRHLLTTPPELLQEIVLQVSTGELPPMTGSTTGLHPNHYYWRTITYDVYSGAGWASSAAQDETLPANTLLFALPRDYRLVTQHVERSPDLGTGLYWTGVLAEASTKIDIAWRTRPPNDPNLPLGGDMLGALTNTDVFTVESYLPQFSAQELRATGADYPPEIVRRYLQLPDSVPERVLALARELTQATPTPYDRAAAIESYLRSFPYTLEVKPPPPGRDVVDYFLFTAQQGYCDYYASSMVVLARAAGLPARMVIGYASGDYDFANAEYIVRQADAHSWAEVYFSGIGWVEFEPTSSQPVIERVGGTSASGPSPSLPGGLSTVIWLRSQWRFLISSLGGQFMIAGLGFVLLFILWQVGEMGFLYLIPAHIMIPRIYVRMERASVRLLPELSDGHTPHQLGTALALKLKNVKNQMLRSVFSVAEVEIDRVVSLYVTQVFSGHPPAKSQISQGVRAWTRLRWRLWVANRWVRYLADRS